MKKQLVTMALLVICCSHLNAQSEKDSLNVSLEQSIFGIQLGMFGIESGLLEGNIYNESRLSKNWSLRSQIALSGDYSFTERFTYELNPKISIEPRYYYNLFRRKKRNKDITNNAGNYFGFKMNYLPYWFNITNKKDNERLLRNNQAFSIMPTYGFRRNIGKHFDFEFNVGLGAKYDNIHPKKRWNLDIDLNFKIGYRF